MARDQAASCIDSALATKRPEQSIVGGLDVIGKVVQPIAAFAGQPSGGTLSSERDKRPSPREVCLALQPPRDPVSRRLPRSASAPGAGHWHTGQCKAVSRSPCSFAVRTAPRGAPRHRQASGQVRRAMLPSDCRLQGLNNRPRIVAQQGGGKIRVISPVRATGCLEQVRQLGSRSSHKATRSTGWRQAVVSSAPRAATI